MRSTVHLEGSHERGQRIPRIPEGRGKSNARYPHSSRRHSRALVPLTSRRSAGTWHWFPLDPQVYAVSFVPFHANLLDGLWISLAAMLISVGATLVPARAAARLLPVEILRFE